MACCSCVPLDVVGCRGAARWYTSPRGGDLGPAFAGIGCFDSLVLQRSRNPIGTRGNYRLARTIARPNSGGRPK